MKLIFIRKKDIMSANKRLEDAIKFKEEYISKLRDQRNEATDKVKELAKEKQALEEKNKKLETELAAAKIAINSVYGLTSAKIAISMLRLAYAATQSSASMEELVNTMKIMAESDKTKELKGKVLKTLDCCESVACKVCPYYKRNFCIKDRNNDIRKLLGAEVKKAEEKKEEPVKPSEPTEPVKEDKMEDPEVTKKRIINDLHICTARGGCKGCSRKGETGCYDNLIKDAIKALGGTDDDQH